MKLSKGVNGESKLKWQIIFTIFISLFLICFPFTAAWLFLKISFICYKCNYETLQILFIGMVFLMIPMGLISNILLLTYLSYFIWSLYKNKTVLIGSIIISLLAYIPICIMQIIIYFLGLGGLFPKV